MGIASIFVGICYFFGRKIFPGALLINLGGEIPFRKCCSAPARIVLSRRRISHTLAANRPARTRNDQLESEKPRITRSLLSQKPVAMKKVGDNSPSQSTKCSVKLGSIALQVNPEAGNHCSQLCFAATHIPHRLQAPALTRARRRGTWRSQTRKATKNEAPMTKYRIRWKMHRWQASSRSATASRTANRPSPDATMAEKNEAVELFLSID